MGYHKYQNPYQEQVIDAAINDLAVRIPDNIIRDKMIKAYENDTHKYNVVDNNTKLLFIHYFRYLIYGKTGFNWSSFVRLMEKLIITEYPTKKAYDEYFITIFKKEDTKCVMNIILEDEDKLTDKQYVEKYLPQKTDWFKEGVEDTFVYKSERVQTITKPDGTPRAGFAIHYDKIDERAQTWLKMCEIRPSLRSEKAKKDIKWLEDNK